MASFDAPDRSGPGSAGALRLVFAGTPEFAERALDRILGGRHQVVAVLTQPDRPSGRGQRRVASPVKRRALGAGLTVLQPLTLRTAEVCRGAGGVLGAPAAASLDMATLSAEATLAALEAVAPDVIVVAAYGLMLPARLLRLPRLGCLNIHASLLPRWRGAAPIVRAIEAGDVKTGVCIMKMDAGLDTGPVAQVRTTAIGENDTATSLTHRLAGLGADAIVDVLDSIGEADTRFSMSFTPQPEEGISYARKVEKSEARIRWQQDAISVARQIRAFDDQPGAYATLSRRPDQPLRCFMPTVLPDVQDRSDSPVDSAAERPAAGEICSAGRDGLVIACGKGRIRVGELQRAGGRRLQVADFLRGFELRRHDRFLDSVLA